MVKSERTLFFPPFHLDTDEELLWRGSQAISLRRKTFALLHYLVTHPGQLLTKEELLRVVWPEASVSEGVLTVGITELRKALGDDAKAPQFIETVHRRGYRFVAPVTMAPQSVPSPRATAPEQEEARGWRLRASAPLSPARHLVGREAELERLWGWLEKARRGERQVVFVTGEAGIGKTTLVEAFLAQAMPQNAWWIAQGQCLEHYGAGEAYMPVLEALGRLCRLPGREYLIALLRRHAPMWLAQMPALLSSADRESLQREILGATRERMLREIAETVEVLTGAGTLHEPPLLVLWLEDLQWSDHSTVDLIACLAQRREPARLLLLGTYRPTDALISRHPFTIVKQELQLHHWCEELPVAPLQEAAVWEYLATRFPGASRGTPVHELASTIHQRTDGNPLFMVQIVDDLLAHQGIKPTHDGWILTTAVEKVAMEVPKSLRQMIERHIEWLSVQEQRLLESASVAGMEFSAAALAGEGEESDCETQCEAFARQGYWLRAHGTEAWPDGTVAACYSFMHALYQQVLYERVPAGRRTQLHRRIGERKERGYGEQAHTIAADLAVHFERGRDNQRALHYLRQAGEKAIKRYAYREATGYLTRALELLPALPHTPEHAQQELMLQLSLGGAVMAIKGYGAPDVERIYARALVLCRQLEHAPQLNSPVVGGLWAFYLVRARLQTARELGEQRLHLARSTHDPALLLLAHLSLGTTLFYLGELASAHAHLAQGIVLCEAHQSSPYASLYEFHPGVACLSYAAWTLWLLGYPDQARQRSNEALTLARTLAHPHSLAAALSYSAWLHQLCREWQAAHQESEAVIALAREQGFVLWLALGLLVRGWALAAQGQQEAGLAQMHAGFSHYCATGAELSQPYMRALLAERYGHVGQIEEGLAILTEALVQAQRNGERYYEAELHRLQGELQQQAAGRVWHAAGLPEAGFQQAIAIARRQGAKSLELRAVMSLSRLQQQQGKREEARQRLAEIYSWFTEGFDTKDLQEAQTLLQELA